MDIEKLKTLIDEVAALPVVEREKTIFDIGTRGHFENPTSDVLAFFCAGEEQHRMGNLVGNSIVELVGNKSGQTLQQSQSPINVAREVLTAGGKRIDLALETNDYLIIIEAKVQHSQVNPFDEYERYGDNRSASDDKAVYYVVLSPNGVVDDSVANKRWIGLSFAELNTIIAQNLHTHLMAKPIDKWVFVLRDFLLHLENLSMTVHTSPNQSFALKNMSAISEAWTLLADSLNQINDQLYQQCVDKYGSGFSHRRSTWFKPLPAFTYALEGSYVEVILFTSPEPMEGERNKGKFFYAQVYVKKEQNPELFEVLYAKLEGKVVDLWSCEKDNSTTMRWPLEHDADLVGEMMGVLEVVREIEGL